MGAAGRGARRCAGGELGDPDCCDGALRWWVAKGDAPDGGGLGDAPGAAAGVRVGAAAVFGLWAGTGVPAGQGVRGEAGEQALEVLGGGGEVLRERGEEGVSGEAAGDQGEQTGQDRPDARREFGGIGLDLGLGRCCGHAKPPRCIVVMVCSGISNRQMQEKSFAQEIFFAAVAGLPQETGGRLGQAGSAPRDFAATAAVVGGVREREAAALLRAFFEARR
jgi:hypothetical protein